MSKNANIFRSLRLKLMTGYLTKEPAEYTFMKRYPPLNRDTQSPVRKVKARKLPFLRLYDQIMERNPIYADERVYPGFWQQEPQALQMAKIQHSLIEAGIDEEEAYHQAVSRVTHLENDSYEGVRKLHDQLSKEGVSISTILSSENTTSIDSFRRLLSTCDYDDLDLADQGNIDYFVQSKILKWNEVERERRMKDPIFVVCFRKLLRSIFPEMRAYEIGDDKRHEHFKSSLFSFYGVEKKDMRPSSKFYYEDYKRYFEKIKNAPELHSWSVEELDELTKWITSTVALPHVLQNPSVSYVELLQNQFFPMLVSNKDAKDFHLPSNDELKALLYENDVGYKNEDDMLYVRRFYMLPSLLFPAEFLAGYLASSNEKVKSLLEEDNTLLNELSMAGMDERSLPEVRKELERYLQNTFPSRDDSSTDISFLDSLILDGSDNDTKPTTMDDANGLRGENTTTNGGTAGDVESTEEDYDLSKYERDHAAWLQLSGLTSENGQDHMILTRAKLSQEYERKEGARRAKVWAEQEKKLKLPSPELTLRGV